MTSLKDKMSRNLYDNIPRDFMDDGSSSAARDMWGHAEYIAELLHAAIIEHATSQPALERAARRLLLDSATPWDKRAPEMQARSCRIVKELILLALGDN